MAKKKAKVSEDQDFRLTKQRLIILKYIRKSGAHPSAEVIYKAVKKKVTSISFGTVYRNLRFLRDHGLLKEFIINKVAHFEARVDSHMHFVCEKCHGIEDINGARDTKIIKEMKKIAEKNRFMVRSENYEIYGICITCQKEKHPRSLTPELFCIACGHLTDDLKKEEPVCKECKFQAECEYIK